MALANVLSIEKGTNEIFNIGCNAKTSIIELYQMIAAFTSNQASPIFMPERKGDIRFSRLDSSKALNQLNWMPAVDLNTGLKETLNYYSTIL